MSLLGQMLWSRDSDRSYLELLFLVFILGPVDETFFMSSHSYSQSIYPPWVDPGMRPSERSPLFRWNPQPRQIGALSFLYWPAATFGRSLNRCSLDTRQANDRLSLAHILPSRPLRDRSCRDLRGTSQVRPRQTIPRRNQMSTRP
jgi:hypothetical protein